MARIRPRQRRGPTPTNKNRGRQLGTTDAPGNLRSPRK
jgi:hypothetical protein